MVLPRVPLATVLVVALVGIGAVLAWLGMPGPVSAADLPVDPIRATAADATPIASTFSAGVLLVALLVSSAITIRLARRPRRRPR